MFLYLNQVQIELQAPGSFFLATTHPCHSLPYCWSVAKLCQTLCDPMDCSMPGFPAFHSQSLLKFMSIELAMPSNHLLLCHPLLLLPSSFLRIRVFSNELVLCIRWPKFWSLSTSPSSEYSGWFLLKLTGLISLQSKGLSRVFSSTTVWKHQFFGGLPSLWSISHICTWLLEKP